MKKILVFCVSLFLISLLALFIATRSYDINHGNIFNLIFEKIYKKIDYVEILGNNLISTEDITAVLYNVNKKDKFILKNKEEIIEDLGKMELIHSVILKYSLPSKLVITVNERLPIMFFYAEDLKINIVDSNFEEFYDSRVNTQELVHWRGKFDKEKAKNIFDILMKFPLIYNNLTEVEDFFGYRFNIVLNNKIQVLLPAKNIEDALSLLNSYIKKYNISRTNIYRIDFRDKKKVFFAVNADVKVYKPEKNKYFVYKAVNTDTTYRDIIESAMKKV